jgi:hypothetical protein
MTGGRRERYACTVYERCADQAAAGPHDRNGGPGALGLEIPSEKPATTGRQTMCSPIPCRRCGKITWTGCGDHAEQVMASIPEPQRCTCAA